MKKKILKQKSISFTYKTFFFIKMGCFDPFITKMDQFTN